MRRILVVDDIEWNRTMIVAVAESAHYEVLQASDGAEALALLARQHVDCIVCDILMPTMDGYAFVRELRRDPRYAAVPVVFYTAAFNQQEAAALAHGVGVDQVLIKPCEPPDILAVLERALQAPSSPRSPARAESDDVHSQLLSTKLVEKIADLENVNRRLDALTSLNLQLASEANPRDLLQHVCRGARELFAARFAVLAAYERNEPRSHVVTWGVPTDATTHLQSVRLDEGVFATVLRERRAMRFTREDIGLNPALTAMRDWTHAVAAPVASLYRVYGCLVLLDRLTGEPFADDDERLLGILAAQVGRIYENGSLNAELTAQLEELRREVAHRVAVERQVMYLNRIYALRSAVNGAIIRVRTRQELFEEICRIAVAEGSFVKAWFATFDDERSCIAASEGCSAAYAQALLDATPRTLASNQGFTNAVIRGGRIAVVNDLTANLEGLLDAPVDRALARQAYETGSRAIAWVPIAEGGRVTGILSLHAGEPDFFTSDERAPLEDLAADIGFALEHIRKSEQLDYLAYYDALTGLANASLFTERLAQSIALATRENASLAVVLFDVARFTAINDAFGRHLGDRLLIDIAQRIDRGTVSIGDVGRLAGDTFAIVVDAFADEQALARIVKDYVIAPFADPFILDGRELRCQVKVGIALFPSDGRDGELLMHHAETALIRAKSVIDDYLFYDERMSLRVQQRVTSENELRAALERRQFVLHYQPKVDLRTGRIVSVEALLRWNRRDGTLVAPSDFIPILEETGLIIDVGAWVMEQAIADHERWREAGLAAPRIAINVSPVQLRRADFLESIERHGERAYAALDIEITETLLMEDVAANIVKLAALAAKGMDIAIDDFGTGYSSFAYLARLPAKTLKIDRSFIASLDASDHQQLLVSTMISLAHSLGMRVVAEGVETAAQEARLRDLGCDDAQGFRYSPAVPADAAGELFRADAEGRRGEALA